MVTIRHILSYELKNKGDSGNSSNVTQANIDKSQSNYMARKQYEYN